MPYQFNNKKSSSNNKNFNNKNFNSLRESIDKLIKLVEICNLDECRDKMIQILKILETRRSYLQLTLFFLLIQKVGVFQSIEIIKSHDGFQILENTTISKNIDYINRLMEIYILLDSNQPVSINLLHNFYACDKSSFYKYISVSCNLDALFEERGEEGETYLDEIVGSVSEQSVVGNELDFIWNQLIYYKDKFKDVKIDIIPHKNKFKSMKTYIKLLKILDPEAGVIEEEYFYKNSTNNNNTNTTKMDDDCSSKVVLKPFFNFKEFKEIYEKNSILEENKKIVERILLALGELINYIETLGIRYNISIEDLGEYKKLLEYTKQFGKEYTTQIGKKERIFIRKKSTFRRRNYSMIGEMEEHEVKNDSGKSIDMREVKKVVDDMREVEKKLEDTFIDNKQSDDVADDEKTINVDEKSETAIDRVSDTQGSPPISKESGQVISKESQVIDKDTTVTDKDAKITDKVVTDKDSTVTDKNSEVLTKKDTTDKNSEVLSKKDVKPKKKGGFFKKKAAPAKSKLSTDKFYCGLKWEKTTKSKESIFSMIDIKKLEESFKLEDFKEFEQSKSTQNKIQPEEDHFVRKVSTALDSKKSLALNIALGRVKTPLEELKKSILDRNLKNENLVKQLLLYMPTTEEHGNLCEEEKEKVILGRAEMLFRLVDNLREFRENLLAIKFKGLYGERNYGKCIREQQETYTRILEMESLKKLFGYLLIIGNQLNMNTGKGKADGFSIDSLPQFQSTKIKQMLINKINFKEILDEFTHHHPSEHNSNTEFDIIGKKEFHSATTNEFDIATNGLAVAFKDLKASYTPNVVDDDMFKEMEKDFLKLMDTYKKFLKFFDVEDEEKVLKGLPKFLNYFIKK